jgi:hypothetical protein
VIILFDIEIDIKIRFILFVETYGSHSADLLFHIIILELQYIIPDSSPKILSWREIYYLGAKYIYWARLFIGPRLFIYSGCVYSVRLCNAP